MIEPIKQQAFGLAALQVLEFTPEYSGRWNEAFERLQDDVREGLSLDQILIPCAIRSLAARKPSSLL
ncbi:hypothetical protein ACV1C9_19075, partial [Aeromonas caviae]